MIKMIDTQKGVKLRALKTPEQQKSATKMLKQMLRSVRLLGKFFSKLLLILIKTHPANPPKPTKAKNDTPSTSNQRKATKQELKQQENYLSMCITINWLLRSHLVTYKYCSYLSRVIIHEKKQRWLRQRKLDKKNFNEFEGLNYLQKFLNMRNARMIVRMNSLKNIHLDRTKLAVRSPRIFPGGTSSNKRLPVFDFKEQIEARSKLSSEKTVPISEKNRVVGIGKAKAKKNKKNNLRDLTPFAIQKFVPQHVNDNVGFSEMDSSKEKVVTTNSSQAEPTNVGQEGSKASNPKKLASTETVPKNVDTQSLQLLKSPDSDMEMAKIPLGLSRIELQLNSWLAQSELVEVEEKCESSQSKQGRPQQDSFIERIEETEKGLEVSGNSPAPAPKKSPEQKSGSIIDRIGKKYAWSPGVDSRRESHHLKDESSIEDILSMKCIRVESPEPPMRIDFHKGYRNSKKKNIPKLVVSPPRNAHLRRSKSPDPKGRRFRKLSSMNSSEDMNNLFGAIKPTRMTSGTAPGFQISISHVDKTHDKNQELLRKKMELQTPESGFSVAFKSVGCGSPVNNGNQLKCLIPKPGRQTEALNLQTRLYEIEKNRTPKFNFPVLDVETTSRNNKNTKNGGPGAKLVSRFDDYYEDHLAKSNISDLPSSVVHKAPNSQNAISSQEQLPSLPEEDTALIPNKKKEMNDARNKLTLKCSDFGHKLYKAQLSGSRINLSELRESQLVPPKTFTKKGTATVHSIQDTETVTNLKTEQSETLAYPQHHPLPQTQLRFKKGKNQLQKSDIEGSRQHQRSNYSKTKKNQIRPKTCSQTKFRARRNLRKKTESSDDIEIDDNTSMKIIGDVEVVSRSTRKAGKKGKKKLGRSLSRTQLKTLKKISKSTMPIEEFLAHLNLDLKMNLDYVFSAGLEEILEFFNSVDNFMIKVVGDQELEVKIDLLKLIIRTTNAITFVDKIYLMSRIELEFLQQWQTFNLFIQVLLYEMKII